MKKINYIWILFLVLILFWQTDVYANLIKIKSLKGNWKFQIGNKAQWKEINYNDSEWDMIYVPSPWENEGYHGFDGYAWYRKEFTLSGEYVDQSLILNLGYIDDVDEVYFNGHLIGYTGSFPPRYQTAYNALREYKIPKHLINFEGKNLIAVKVYDSEIQGGIIHGDIGIFIDPNPLPLDIDLEGIWKFHLSDDLTWLNPEFNDNDWGKILVPGSWENQGYKNHDGYAWYRKKFKMPSNLVNKSLVVVLGKIDDIEEVYINGQLINPIKKLGAVGEYIKTNNNDCNMFRAYFIDGNILKANQINVIAVRVYDGGGAGGIYEGPVGIIDQSKYVKYWRNKNN